MADNTQELALSDTSRFKRTNLLTKNGVLFFGRWKTPNIKLDGDEKQIRVLIGKDSQLDILAQEEYGDRTLWWAIAIVNKIGLPAEEVVVGKILIIPKLSHIKEALQAER